ncbi:MAG: hypothetical protein ABII23_08825 [bacterium]
MIMNKNTFISAGLFLVISLTGCGSKKSTPEVSKQRKVVPVAEVPVKPPEIEKITYEYLGIKFKDPFIPLVGEGSSVIIKTDGEGALDPASLTLKGILLDKNEKLAALVDTSGNSYIIKGKRLYNQKGDIIDGIVGIVKLESVIIITKDKTVRELKLKSEEEY